jgi:hypothetical protein
MQHFERACYDHLAMKKKSKIIKVTLCGPGDVSEEINIAKEVIDEWNLNQWETTGYGLKSQHWNTDAIPTMAERGQSAINHQLVDASGIVVAIFWTRLGTPTGLAGSGTEEEITRAIHREIPVMVYFSNLEAPNLHQDKSQTDKLAEFRARLMNTGLPFTFRNRSQFRKTFKEHLKALVSTIIKANQKKQPPKKSSKPVIQKAQGNSNVQIAGDGNSLTFKGTSKRPRVIIERSLDHISPFDQKRVSDWIKDLAEQSTGKPIGNLITEWWSKFYSQFRMTSYKELKTQDMPAVEAWYRLQLNLIKADRKTSDPNSWKNAKIKSIKMKMGKMKRTNEDYYPELSARLNMKKPFISLTKLSKHDLERVERMVSYDYKKWLES